MFSSHALCTSVPEHEVDAWSLFGVMSLSPGPLLSHPQSPLAALQLVAQSPEPHKQGPRQPT